MKIKLIAFLLVVIGTAVSQEIKTEVPILSADDKLNVRNLQIDTMQAYQELQNTPQYKALLDAQSKQKAAWADVYTRYKVDNTKVVLCDGPAPGPCAAVKKSELVFVSVKKEK